VLSFFELKYYFNSLRELRSFTLRDKI